MIGITSLPPHSTDDIDRLNTWLLESVKEKPVEQLLRETDEKLQAIIEPALWRTVASWIGWSSPLETARSFAHETENRNQGRIQHLQKQEGRQHLALMVAELEQFMTKEKTMIERLIYKWLQTRVASREQGGELVSRDYFSMRIDKESQSTDIIIGESRVRIRPDTGFVELIIEGTPSWKTTIWSGECIECTAPVEWQGLEISYIESVFKIERMTDRAPPLSVKRRDGPPRENRGVK